jgi:hypothetical protein
MKQFWKQMLRNPSGLMGLIILVIAIFLAVLGPMVFPNSPWRMVQRPFLPPFTLSAVPLGTDALGRDVFAGIIYGARVSLLVGLVSTLAALAIGVPLGAIAGYFGGRIDDALMRFTEFFQTIPSFALAIVLVAILQPSIYSIVASIVAHARICPGRHRHRPDPQMDHLARNPAQRTVACDRAGVVDGCDRDPAGIVAVIPRPWRSQSDFVGLYGRRRPHGDPASVVDHRISRLGHPGVRARSQSGWRRPQ